MIDADSGGYMLTDRETQTRSRLFVYDLMNDGSITHERLLIDAGDGMCVDVEGAMSFASRSTVWGTSAIGGNRPETCAIPRAGVGSNSNPLISTRISKGRNPPLPRISARLAYSRKILKSWCISYFFVHLTVKQGLATPLEVQALPVTCLY